MKKETQLKLALAVGLDPKHALVQSATNSPHLAEEFMKNGGFTKEIFAPAESGVSFFNNKEVWPAMPRIIAALRANGETITADDFLQKRDGGNTMIEYAEKFGALKFLFAPKNWENNLEEMEKLWFGTTERFRKTFDFWSHYHEAAKLSNVTLRESVITSAGLDVNTVMEQILNGHAHIVDSALKKNGNGLSKNDLFLIDSHGKTVSEDKRLWDQFEKIAQIVKNNGETLTLDDFDRSRAGNKSLFESAVQQARVTEIFKPSLWKGRLGEMYSLYYRLHSDRKDAVDIQALVSDLEDYEFSHLVDIDKGMNAAALTTAHMVKTSIPTVPAFTIYPLGLQKTWHNIWGLDTSRKNSLPDIGIADLRKVHGPLGQTCLHAAARFGFIEVVIDMLKERGEWFAPDDLTVKKNDQPCVLDILAKQNKVALLLDPACYVGTKERRDHMIKIWQSLPDTQKKEHDIDQMLTQLNRLNIRHAAAQRNAPKPKL